MLPHALVCYPDGTFSEYFYSAVSRVYRTTTYAPLEELLSHSDYRLEEMLSLCAAYPSWVLAVGLNYDCIFYGSNVEGNVLIQGDYDPFRYSNDSRFLDLSNIVQGAFLPDDNQGFREYGEIINSPSWRSVAPLLINLGILPDLPPNAPLDPIQTSEGWVYWRMIWN